MPMHDVLLTNLALITGGGAAGDETIASGFLAIDGGRIAALGPWPEPAGAEPRQGRLALDLPGRVATPGLVNIHTHAVLSLMRGIAVDLGFAPAYTKGVPHGHEIGPEDAAALARLGALECLLFGSTLMVDSYVHADVTMPAMLELGLRVHACGRVHDVDFSTVHEGRWSYDPAIGRARLDDFEGLMSRWRGAADGRADVILAPHAPDTCSDAYLAEVAALARATGLRVTTHLSQSQAENRVIAERSAGRTPTELLDHVGLLNDRLIAAHCIYVTPDDVARIGAAGVTVAHVPKGNATGGAMAPTPRLRAAGANLALGTDNLTGDMTEIMRWAIAVARVQEGGVSDAWQPRHALAMATRNGARALGLDDRLGRLAPGLAADIVVYDFRKTHLTPLLDPLGTLVHDGFGRDVEHVLVDGRHVVAGGRALFADETRIRREAQAAAERLWRDARAAA